jgi:ATP-binding cassette subfamily B protein
VLDVVPVDVQALKERLAPLAALHDLFESRTSLVIAHRLSAGLAADSIFVLDGGRILERDTHHELVECEGLYATLYQRQFRTEPAVDETALA